MRGVRCLGAAALLLPACLPLGLGGTVGGMELAFEETIYVELRAVDAATAVPFHQIELWLMPFEDSCTRMTELLAALRELRLQYEDGLAPTDYCAAWEETFAAYTGAERFWVGQLRLQALPRGDNETPQTLYDFYPEAEGDVPPGPSWDGDLARYPAPDFEACAGEFEGETPQDYAPDLFAGSGGSVDVRRYEEDGHVTARLEPTFEGQGRERLRGRVDADFCPGALDWPLVFGLGSEDGAR